jgi:hypothetical protein
VLKVGYAINTLVYKQIHKFRRNPRATLVPQVRVQHDEGRSRLSAAIASGSAEPVDEYQARVIPAHDGKPRVSVVTQESVLALGVGV